MKKRKPVGSWLDQLMAEDGALAEAEAIALKRVMAWQVERGMGEKMARAMRTSRDALDRLLDPQNESVTLRTMARAARVLGKRWRLELREYTSRRRDHIQRIAHKHRARILAAFDQRSKAAAYVRRGARLS